MLGQNTIPEETIEEIRKTYRQTVLKHLRQGDTPYKAARKAGRTVNELYNKWDKSSIREKTTIFRDNDGNLRAEEFEEFSEKINDYYGKESKSKDPDEEEWDRETAMDRDDVYYNKSEDKYIVYFDYFEELREFDGEDIRYMRRRYSGGDYINEIAIDIGMPPKAFKELKMKLGWTHQDPPFTEEEVEERSEESLTEDYVSQKLQSVVTSGERQVDKKLKRKGKEYIKFEKNVLEPLEDLIEENSENYDVPYIQLGSDIQGIGEYCLVTSPYDFHYGVRGWTSLHDDDHCGLEDAENRLIERSEDNIAQLPHNPDRVIICIGSDFCHIDTTAGTTTRGTNVSIDEDPEKILYKASEVVRKYIDVYRQVTNNLHIYGVPGNHDEAQSISAVNFLYAWFRNNEDVTVHRGNRPRVYDHYGVTAFGFGHGRNERRSRLGPLMMNEGKEHWAKTKQGVFFVGDKHHYKKKEWDNEGIIVLQLESLMDFDSWHKKEGWITANKALRSFIFDKKEGWKNSPRSPVIK